MTTRRKIVDHLMVAAQDEDFNPDMVHCCMLDSYDEGFNQGMIFSSIVAITGLTLWKIVRVIKNKKKNKESE